MRLECSLRGLNDASVASAIEAVDVFVIGTEFRNV